MTQFAYADRIPEEILAWGDELARIRQDLHEHPELGFDTARTCGVIAAKLREWGITCDDLMVPGGVIALVEGNRPGPTVALRADMDALAMPDCSGNPWQSVVADRYFLHDRRNAPEVCGCAEGAQKTGRRDGLRIFESDFPQYRHPRIDLQRVGDLCDDEGAPRAFSLV
ncbi:hypothetical protein [uncultured Sutterella sp.]|uniref:hypothetical protein n=1 Tax=uncultured Sutterella sp. TaxID=286133 RepID=UPI00280C3103|nr:hypothetical protein [uncultured Sutterella sp.]